STIWGAWEGALAALLLLLMPRLLFHAGLACFDAPMVAVWFATVAAYHAALSSRRWAIGAGVAFGLALATKHNALLLPPALFVHAAIIGWRDLASDLRAKQWKRAITREPLVALAAMAVIGPLVLYALWPWLWSAPIAHAKAWIKFHLDHVHYNFEYLGENWNHPRFPWHVAIITTLFTVPVVTLAGAALGARVMVARWWTMRREKIEGDPTKPGLLILVSAIAAMGPFLLGSTPIFGAEKHWAPAMPSFAIAAGIGVVWAARQLAALFDQQHANKILAAVAVVIASAAAVETFHAQPYALTEYNALAGGAPGGADLGMNRQFWGYSARGVLPWLGEHKPGRVYTHDASPAWGWYIKAGLVPPLDTDSGSEFSGGIERSDYALVIHELHFNRHDYLIWKAYGTVQPAFVLTVDGVPIVSVYSRDRSR
ncbi:MAG TPA: glycosyltransferase family 39 protein, partial [Kofleriaceae bacterium]|nr:glycosyltransferase family 39 protein [Kofleriaceae bacterium]